MARANLEFLAELKALALDENGSQPAQVTQEPHKRKKTATLFGQRGNPREA